MTPRTRGWLLGLALGVMASWPACAARAAATGAALLVDVEPREPWVGEPVVLRVRLVLQRDLAEEPAYVPPVTTGFWSEAPSRPESYYATQGGRRVLVTETRTRLYPLAPGMAHVGPASAGVVFAGEPGVTDERGTREQTLRSAPVSVTVQALPSGAPAGFDGAVGRFTVTWSADRRRTSLDVPVGVWLDVRGTGNLALMKVPVFLVAGAEVLVGAREDSLPSAGSAGAGRVRFHWNVLARRTGALAIPPPRFAWFDPGVGGYRSAVPPTPAVEVGPALFSPGPGRDEFPDAFGKDAPDPSAAGPRPWVGALAGLLLGAALALWRVRPAPDPRAEERGRVAAWRNALRGPAGPAFWRAAEEAAEWLAGTGRMLGDLRAAIAATRYGGAETDVDAVRTRLQGELSVAGPPRRRRPWTRPAGVLLGALGIALLALAVFPRGDGAAAGRMRAADRAARSGDIAEAQADWLALWREGARSPAVAARLAWVELTAGRLASASVWVLRGERLESRDRALRWVGNLVREGGGLAGAAPARLPVRREEWGLLALLLGVSAGALWPRRGVAVALAVLAVLAAGAAPVDDLRAAGRSQAVVSRTTDLAGSGLELESGQVVEVLRREGGSARVRVGRDLSGLVRADALLPVGEVR